MLGRKFEYTKDFIETIRKNADECDYSMVDLGRKMKVGKSTTTKWVKLGYITGKNESIVNVRKQRMKEKAIEAIKIHGSVKDAAKSLYMSKSGFYGILERANYATKNVEKFLQPRKCKICKSDFQSLHPAKAVCSQKCANEQAKNMRKMRYRKENNISDSDLSTLQKIYEKNKNALSEFNGCVYKAAQKLGMRRQSLWKWIRSNDMQEYIATLRNREKNVDYIIDLLEQNNWKIRTVDRLLNRAQGFTRSVLISAGRKDLLDNAPCPICGKMTPRASNYARTVCSNQCYSARMAIENRKHRENRKKKEKR